MQEFELDKNIVNLYSTISQLRKKRSDELQQGSSKLEENSIDDTLSNRLSEFVKVFVNRFKEKLDGYRKEAAVGGEVKGGKASNFAGTAVEEVAKAAKVPGANAMGEVVRVPFNKHHREKAKRVVAAFMNRQEGDIRKDLVSVGGSIFQSFENQFRLVTDDNQNWKRAMEKLAKDAVNRAMSYIDKCKKENPGLEISIDLITKGVILGKSKGTIIIRKFAHAVKLDKSVEGLKLGHTIKVSGEEWKTVDLYETTGIVRINENGNYKYYRKRYKSESNVEKYGYRLLFKWESWESESKLYRDCEKPSKEYVYALKPEELEKKLKVILDNINKEDPQQTLGRIESKVDKLSLENGQNEQSILFDVKEPVTLFTGRREELTDLHSKIQRNSEKVTVISQMTSISGLGGVGKTQLSRQYIHENSKDYDNNIIWINAESEAALIESFSRLTKDKLRISTQGADGKEKDIKSIVEEVYEFFSKRKSLFVFDNAEKNEYLNKFLPLCSLAPDANKPYILITSRNREWERGIEVMDLNELKLEDAKEFVKKGLDVEGESQDQGIKTLVEKLQRFPLAIQQAIAYIKDQKVTGKFSIDDYLEEYEKKTKDLLDSEVFKGIDNDYAKTTFTTWKITIDKIASDSEHGQLALKILDAIAYFAPESINREIFLDLASDDERKLRSAVRLLVKYSMINGEQNQSVLSIHRLVQEVTRLGLKGQGKEEESLKKALKLVEANFKKENLDHAVSVWNHASKYEKLVKEFSKLPSRIVSQLDDAVRYEEAYLFGKKASTILDGILWTDHPDTLSTMSSIADVLYKQGKYDEALKEYKEVLGRREKVLGENNPDTLSTENSIADVLYKQGKYDEALKEYKEVLEKRKEALPQDHHDTLSTMRSIAVVLNNKGEYDDALKICNKVIEKKAGNLDRGTLSTMHEKARALDNLGRYREAIKAYGEVLDGQAKIPNPDRYSVLYTQHGLGRALSSQGEYEEALKTYEKVLKKRKEKFGSDSPDTLATMNNIAVVLNKQGKYDKALDKYKEVLEGRKEKLGEDHPSTLYTLHGMAKVLSNQGKYDKALKDFQDVLKERIRVLGQDQPATLSTMHEIAGVLGNQRKYKEALEKYKEVLEKREKVLPQDHPSTLSTRNGIAKVLEKHGKDEEALKIFQEVYEKRKEKLGENHPDTLETIHGIAGVFDKQDEYNKAFEKYKEVLEKREKVLGTDHPATLSTMHEIARVLGNQRKYKEALEKYKEVLKEREKKLGSNHPDTRETKSEIDRLSKLLESLGKHQINEVSAEKCLPSTSHSRRREAKGECLFTWEDVDEFSLEKDEKRDFSKIKIDSEKFVDYIKDLPEGKQSQLIQLASEAQVTGRFQVLVNKLTSNQKVISHLNRVGRISGVTMHGMMAKNVLADFLNGDYQGVAINVGFIAGGQGFAKVAEAASLKGLKLASEGKLLLGRSLRAASPFLARGTSAFVIYDLVNQIKAFKNGTEEALVGVVGDSIYLGVDAAEIGIEIAEAFEVLEGVSSVTGPIGAAVGAIVFVDTDIYMAVKRVDKIDEMIHLTGKEKFAEGLRAFIGMQPEEHIQELMQEKQVSNQLVRQGLEYLKQHNDIQSYVFPTGKSIVDSCRKVPYKTSNCASGGFEGGCLRASTVTRYAEECTTKFEVDLDNTVLLDEKRNNIKWSRARPDDPSGGELFCLPRGNHERVPSYGSYLCENAIGITDLSAKTGNYTLINLGEGTDHAKGFIDSPNIFVVNNGSKRYFGGNKDDIFILQGSSIKGYFYGEGGVNTLDLTSFAPEEGSIEVKLHIGQVEDYYRNNFFGMSGINKFLGRKAKADQVFITCDSDTSDIKFVDGQSGSEEFVDHINIYDKDCAYEMQVVVRSNTVIYNRALKGDFHYIVPYALGSAKVDFIYTAEALNLNNTFVFEYEPAQIKNVDVRNINVLNKTSHIITFNFSPMSDKEFNITISGASNPSYRLGNNTEIKVGNKGNLYMLENANKSVDEIIRDYLVVANRLNRMSFFIQSLLSNETVAIGSGNYEVIHNNPLQKSHLVGNGGENVYVIDCERFEIPLPEVVIYDLDVESSVDTIDLRNLVQQARGEFSSSFKLQVLKSANDLLLKATVEKSTEDSSISKVRGHEYFTVRLKDGVNWYNKTHVVMDNVPMRISLDSNEWSLKPQPLMFEKDKEVIVVTSQDVEENTELITPKRAGNYTFVRDHGSDLIITNAFNTQDNLCTIVLSKFYETPKMGTLSIKFADKEIVLKDKQKEINAARDVDIVKREHKKQVYSDVFNRSPEVMLSDQPHRHEHSRQHIRNRRMVSSSAKPSSWINDLFNWVKSSIGELLSSNTTSSISQVDGQIDVDGAIMLLDLLVRKVTGQKYISIVDQPISSLEAQGYALNIIEKFEKVLNETAVKSGISVTNLNFDPVAVQSAIVRQIINGRFSEISKTLYSSAKEACPEFKQTDKFLDHLRSSLESKKEAVLLQQKVEKPSKILDQQVSRKVELSKKPNTFLNGTSVVKGISSVLER